MSAKKQKEGTKEPMRIIVIPDVHLKPWMFDEAENIIKKGEADRTVCLGDLADDWNQQMNLSLYEETYDRAISFAREFPETLWCYGNHDISYVWQAMETGYSLIADRTVNEKLRKLREALPDPMQLTFIHRIEDILFMHGGLCTAFVEEEIEEENTKDIDRVIGTINGFEFEHGYTHLWQNISPLWLRPQYREASSLYKPEKYLQVVGHTPVWKVTQKDNLISTDCFSTSRDGLPLGRPQFLVIDTETKECRLFDAEWHTRS